MAVLALPKYTESPPQLPAVATVYASWTRSDESWRADKPCRPWFRGPAPQMVAAAMGVVSLDLSALGMGVPEIFPTHQSAHHEQGHGAARDIGLDAVAEVRPFDLAALPAALFDAPHAAGQDFALDHGAWMLQSDSIEPFWRQTDHHASHDWMA